MPKPKPFRLLLPIKRFSIPSSQTQLPLPSLTGRQFVVSKMGSAQEKVTRLLFWYREELLSRLKVTWKEVGGLFNIDTLLADQGLNFRHRDHVSVS